MVWTTMGRRWTVIIFLFSITGNIQKDCTNWKWYEPRIFIWIHGLFIFIYMYTSIYCNHKKQKSCTDFGVYPWVKDFLILGNQVLLPSFCHVQLKDRILWLWLQGSSFIQPKTHSSNQTNTYNFLSHTVKKGLKQKRKPNKNFSSLLLSCPLSLQSLFTERAAGYNSKPLIYTLEVEHMGTWQFPNFFFVFVLG